MSKIPTYFVRPCGICGRTLHIPVSLLGEMITCEHCGGTFLAHDDSVRKPNVKQTVAEFTERVDMLLSAAQNQRQRGMAIIDMDYSPEDELSSDVSATQEDD